MSALKPVPMCCVTIGYQSFLLPAADGLKVVQLMNGAIECQRTYSGGDGYVIGDQPRVTYEAVRPNQVRARAQDEPEKRSIRFDPVALPALKLLKGD